MTTKRQHYSDTEYILTEMDKMEGALATALIILGELVALNEAQDAGGCDADKHDAAMTKAKALLQFYESLCDNEEME